MSDIFNIDDKHPIRIIPGEKPSQDYLAISDLLMSPTAKEDKNIGSSKDVNTILRNYLRRRHTLELIREWELLHNPTEFDFHAFQTNYVLRALDQGNMFSPSFSSFVEETKAKSISIKRGRNGGTFVAFPIAFDFAFWISPKFELLVIEDYLQYKFSSERFEERVREGTRLFAAVNYELHTLAIKDKIITEHMSDDEIRHTFATEADLFNKLVFHQTAAEWRRGNPSAIGNIRDYATPEQQILLANLEYMNAKLVEYGRSFSERARSLQKMAEDDLPNIQKAMTDVSRRLLK